MMNQNSSFAGRCIRVNGPVIVGAGPTGLATAACLKQKGVPYVILERADCIASLWQKKTYDRLKLNLPRHLCKLPHLSFPEHFPEYPTKYQYISYLETYANRFKIAPHFNASVSSAEHDETLGLWRVKTLSENDSLTEYLCRWLVVATGVNAEKVVPQFEGLDHFGGQVVHACDYKTGQSYEGKTVLVVGCGNSGIDITRDLYQHNANPFTVARNPEGRVFPRETKIVPAIKKFSQGEVELDNGEVLEIDSIILATGYCSNVKSWLMESEFFSSEGYPKTQFPNGWKGKVGLYAAGFTRAAGLYGGSLDAINVAQDIAKIWKEDM